MKNSEFNVRLATAQDMNEIYMMGFDVWADDESAVEYLKGCCSSEKYKRGNWYVLNAPSGERLSSLITYSFDSKTAGIGSIATPPLMRRKGDATCLIKTVLECLQRDGVNTVFLYSDINPYLYESLGFQALPKNFQKYEKSLCMVWGKDMHKRLSAHEFQPPDYF